MNKIYEYKSSTLEFKDVDQKQGIVTGYFAAFNNVDSDGDIIRKGAFAKTIVENGPKSSKPRIKHLLNHNASLPLGALLELKEDDYGLYYESKIGTHTLGKDFMKMVESGLITEHSIGYGIVKRKSIQSYDQYKNNPSMGLQELLELKQFEGSSLTGWGVNEATPLTGVKAFNTESIVDRIEKMEKFCRNSNASDETIELLLLEIKQYGQMVLDLKKPTEPVKTTQPEIVGLGLINLRTVVETELLNLSI